MLLDVGYVVNNVLPPFQGEKRKVFLAILAVARMVIWTTRKKGLYDDANFSHPDVTIPPRPHVTLNSLKQFHFLTGDHLVVPIGASHISS